jgi:single-stranded-DNA-specific exonuclease
MMQYSDFMTGFLEHNKIPKEQWQEHLNQEPTFPDLPHLPEAKDIYKLFQTALDNKQRIMLSADYDADGTTAAIVMYKYLKHAGFNLDKETLYLPTRENGYGMSAYAIKQMKEKHDVKILITMDCGISNVKEIEYAKSVGIKTIICDHHTVGEQVPDADFILHPEVNDGIKELKHFSGSGIAFYLCWLLEKEFQTGFPIKEWAAIASIGTVGDMVPMLGMNRQFVKFGLDRVRNTEIAGLKALKEVSKATPFMDEESLAFQIIPRLNAAGRLADPIWSFATLATDNYDQALESAKKLDKLNASRREICAEYIELAETLVDHSHPIIIVSSDQFKHGIVGITAANLVDKYNKPAFVIANEGFRCKGSARTPAGFNTYKALENAKHILNKWGGHEAASGFELHEEHLDELQIMLNESYYQQLEDRVLNKKIYNAWDSEWSSDIKQLLKEIEYLKPFGQGFKSPEYSLRAPIEKPSTSLSRTHLFCKFLGIKCVGWGLFNESLTDGSLCDIVFTVGSTDYQRKKPYVRFNIKSIERVES